MMRDNIILLGEYGSVAQGTAGPDSDHDYMAIFMETPQQVIGLEEVDSKRDSDAAEGEKSAPGSSDTTYHSLRKFVKLAAGGNPTIGTILFLPEYEQLRYIGERLLDIRQEFVTKKAGRAYLGYMDAQIKAFNETGRKNRAELVDVYGYDIKFAYHAYRLGVQGIQLLFEGAPGVPMTGAPLNYAKRIRAGRVSKDEAMSSIANIRAQLEHALNNSKLPERPNMERINDFLVQSHNDWWG